MAKSFVFEGHRPNVRLDSMLVVLELAGNELEASTRRLRSALDKLEIVTTRHFSS